MNVEIGAIKVSHADRYQVIVDSEAWKGTRGELAVKVAPVVGTSTARARAILDVAGQPIAEFASEVDAAALAGALRDVGVGVELRHRVGLARSLRQVADQKSGSYVSPSARTDVGSAIDRRTQRPGWSGAFGAKTPDRRGDSGTVVGLPGFDELTGLDATFGSSRLAGGPPQAGAARSEVVATADTLAPADFNAAAPGAGQAGDPASGWADILGAALGEPLVAGPADQVAAPVRAGAPKPLVAPPPELGGALDVRGRSDDTSQCVHPVSRATSDEPGCSTATAATREAVIGGEGRAAVDCPLRRADLGEQLEGEAGASAGPPVSEEARPSDSAHSSTVAMPVGGDTVVRSAGVSSSATIDPRVAADRLRRLGAHGGEVPVDFGADREGVPPVAAVEPAATAEVAAAGRAPMNAPAPLAPAPAPAALAGDLQAGSAGLGVGDRFEILRPRPASLEPTPAPTPGVAALWGVLAPGAGFAYLGESARGAAYAMGSVLVVPWVAGIVAAARVAAEIRAGRRLVRRRSTPMQNVRYVLTFWGVVVLVGWVLFWTLAAGSDVGSGSPAPVVGVESVDMGPQVDVTTTLAGDSLRDESEEEAAEVFERQVEVRDLVNSARDACAAERWVECQEYAVRALEIDEQNREAQVLHVRAISRGVVVPASPSIVNETSP